MERKRLIGSGSICKALSLSDLPDMSEDISEDVALDNTTVSLHYATSGLKTNQQEFVYVPKKLKGIHPIDIPAPVISVPASFVSHNTLTITQGYNNEVNSYFELSDTMQATFNKQTMIHMNALKEQADAAGITLTNSKLRYTGNWNQIKDFVARQELMKIKVGATPDLELSKKEIAEIRAQIKDLDLTDMDNDEVQKVINRLWQKNYEPEYMEALKDFKATGKVSKYLQEGKLEELAKELEKVDLEKITGPEFKRLKDNYIEQIEGDHDTSVSADPEKQSHFDNVRMRKTSVHDEMHKDENGNINYRKPKYGKGIDRKQEIKEANSERVLQKQLVGLAAAVGIAAGIGFSLGFVSTLAQSGISPETLKYAFINGGKAAIESGVMGGVGYGIGQTFGKILSQTLSDAIVQSLGKSVAQATVENISRMCSMGVIGGLMIVITSVYQFAKLKIQGYSTKEALIRVGKNALVSIVILGLSIAAQGIWGGYAGLIVSISSAVLMVSVNIGIQIHDRTIRERISGWMVTLYLPEYAQA